MSEITWTPKLVKVKDLIENPDNPKIISEIGKRRLNKSLKRWGLAGTIIINTDMRILDGHSRKKELIDAGIKDVWVSMPSKQLSDQDYKDFNALIDLAKAGKPDMMIIEKVISEDLITEWEIGQDVVNDKSNKIGGKLLVQVTMENENQQKLLYERLTNEGYACAIISF